TALPVPVAAAGSVATTVGLTSAAILLGLPFVNTDQQSPVAAAHRDVVVVIIVIGKIVGHSGSPEIPLSRSVGARQGKWPGRFPDLPRPICLDRRTGLAPAGLVLRAKGFQCRQQRPAQLHF